jgi:hypothetical protein
MFRFLANNSPVVALLPLALFPAFGQSVISTHSGVVHYFEGDVFVGDRQLQPHFARFATVDDGAELRTGAGRAEVLLTPGVILRVGENSAIRMISSTLSDTRVEVLNGSAILNSSEPQQGTAVTLLYKQWRIAMRHQGEYRVDSDPPRLTIRDGQAEVFADGRSAPIEVKNGMSLPFASALVPEQAAADTTDSLAGWADGRNQSIAADNAIASQIVDGPGATDSSGLALGGFTYYPLIGLSSAYPYGAYSPYQPGFYSLYLPGLSYRPSYLYAPFSVGYGYRSVYAPYQPGYPRAYPRITSAPAPVHIGGGGVVLGRPGAAAPHVSAPRPVPAHAGGHR